MKISRKRYLKVWKIKNKNKVKIHSIRGHRKARTLIKEIIKDTKQFKCQDCKKKYSPECMEFDHLEPRNFCIANAAVIASIPRFLAELMICDLVCANCHKIRTYKRKLEKYGL